MKTKLTLIAIALLAIAPFANAALVSSTQGYYFKMDISAPSATITTGDTVTVQILTGSDVTVSGMLSTVLNISKASSISAVTISNIGAWGSSNASTSVAGGGFNVNVDGTLSNPIPVNTSIYSFSFVAGAAGTVVIDATGGTWDTWTAATGNGNDVEAYSSFGAPYGLPYAEITVAAIPEPITVALLGLGGLFVARKKK